MLGSATNTNAATTSSRSSSTAKQEQQQHRHKHQDTNDTTTSATTSASASASSQDQKRSLILSVLEQAISELSVAAGPFESVILVQDNALSLPGPLSQTWRKQQGWSDLTVNSTSNAAGNLSSRSMTSASTFTASQHPSAEHMEEVCPAPPSFPQRQSSIGSSSAGGTEFALEAPWNRRCAAAAAAAAAGDEPDYQRRPKPPSTSHVVSSTTASDNTSGTVNDKTRKTHTKPTNQTNKNKKTFQYPSKLDQVPEDVSCSSFNLSSLAPHASMSHMPPRRQGSLLTDSSTHSSSSSLPTMPQRQASDRSFLSTSSNESAVAEFMMQFRPEQEDGHASFSSQSTTTTNNTKSTRSHCMGDSCSPIPLSLFSSASARAAPHMPQRQDSVSTLGSRQSSTGTLGTQDSFRSLTSSASTTINGGNVVGLGLQKEMSLMSITEEQVDPSQYRHEIHVTPLDFNSSRLSSTSTSSSASSSGLSSTARRHNLRSSFRRQETLLTKTTAANHHYLSAVQPVPTTTISAQ